MSGLKHEAINLQKYWRTAESTSARAQAYDEAIIERQMPLHVGAEELQLVQSSVTCVSHALQKKI